MSKPLFIAVSLLSLSACSVVNSAEQGASDVKDGVYNSASNIKEWAMTPPPVPKKNPVPDSYCYHVLQDILCYRQPIPGWEYRSAGYQGTGAVPPPPAVTEPLPQAVAQSVTPDNRLLDMKPIPIPKMASQPKPASNGTVAETTVNTLPDPATAPEL